MIEIARFFADVPPASFEVAGFGAGHAAASHLALVALAWWAALDAGGDRLTASVLDVGQGDAILTPTPFLSSWPDYLLTPLKARRIMTLVAKIERQWREWNPKPLPLPQAPTKTPAPATLSPSR